MKDDNIFLWVKAVIAAACGAFTAAFGWLGLAGGGLGCLHGAGLALRAARRPPAGESGPAPWHGLASGTRLACWSWSLWPR